MDSITCTAPAAPAAAADHMLGLDVEGRLHGEHKLDPFRLVALESAGGEREAGGLAARKEVAPKAPRLRTGPRGGGKYPALAAPGGATVQ
jgi:hypothetical protein